MSDISDLLRRHGAPLPNAMPLETEVRTEGLLAFKTLAVPEWSEKIRPSASLGEWRCTLDHDAVDALQILIKTVLPSGFPMEQVLNETLQALDIGSYMGTFIEQGMLPDGAATVRVMFAYRSTKYADIGEINRAIHALLVAPGEHEEASGALMQLREIWRGGTDKWEGGLMMLSEVNLYDPADFPFTGAKLGRR